eukprot:2989841-Alexandrium_andersonii.AAC.1
MERPDVQCGVGHMCRFGMTAPVPACTGGGSVSTDAGRQLVRKPTPRPSSPEARVPPVQRRGSACRRPGAARIRGAARQGRFRGEPHGSRR